MKKMMMALALVMALALIGCGNAADTDGTEADVTGTEAGTEVEDVKDDEDLIEETVSGFFTAYMSEDTEGMAQYASDEVVAAIDFAEAKQVLVETLTEAYGIEDGTELAEAAEQFALEVTGDTIRSYEITDIGTSGAAVVEIHYGGGAVDIDESYISSVYEQVLAEYAYSDEVLSELAAVLSEEGDDAYQEALKELIIPAFLETLSGKLTSIEDVVEETMVVLEYIDDTWTITGFVLTESAD